MRTKLETYPTEATEMVYEQERKFPLEEIIRLRYKHNLSINQIADKMGAHKTTIFRKLQKYIKVLPNPEEVESYRQNKVDYLQGLELNIYNEMCNPEKLKDASLNNLAYSFQGIYNANRLESGKSTSNISVAEVNGTIADLQSQADALRKAL